MRSPVTGGLARWHRRTSGQPASCSVAHHTVMDTLPFFLLAIEAVLGLAGARVEERCKRGNALAWFFVCALPRI